MFISLLRKEIKTMGKKYVPSGYQIINIELIDTESGKKILDSDDAKILKEILVRIKNNEIKYPKPILFHIYYEGEPMLLTAFGAFEGASVSCRNNGYEILIDLDSETNDFVVTFTAL